MYHDYCYYDCSHDQSYYYYSVADAKQQIFNGGVDNLNLKNFEKLNNFNLTLGK